MAKLGLLLLALGISPELLSTTAAPSGRHASASTRRLHTLGAEGAALSVSVTGELPFSDAEVLAWVQRSAQAITAYYGRFPVAAVTIGIESARGVEGLRGRTLPEPTPFVRVHIGSECAPDALDDDWVLVHEFVHLALPALAEAQLWFEEGVASYVEPVARHQGGLRSQALVLTEWVHGMPRGQPLRGDQGLDRTHTWARTYWGGALFCLLADVTIRERTANRSGLQDALRAVLAELGDCRRTRSIEEVIAVADAAVGVPVLRELYDAHARRAVATDLELLWQRLGIRSEGRWAEADEHAPLAGVRRAILAPRR